MHILVKNLTNSQSQKIEKRIQTILNKQKL